MLPSVFRHLTELFIENTPLKNNMVHDKLVPHYSRKTTHDSRNNFKNKNISILGPIKRSAKKCKLQDVLGRNALIFYSFKVKKIENFKCIWTRNVGNKHCTHCWYLSFATWPKKQYSINFQTSTCVDKQNHQDIKRKVYNSIWIQPDFII